MARVYAWEEEEEAHFIVLQSQLFWRNGGIQPRVMEEASAAPATGFRTGMMLKLLKNCKKIF